MINPEGLMATIKIKPSHQSQGEYVLIEEEQFDPAIHELLEAPAEAKAEAPRKPGRPPKGK